MKEAVFARHHLAAAHADYCRSLRVTGSSLSLFSQGEPLLTVSPSTPSVLLPHFPPSSKSKSPTPSLSSFSLPNKPPPVKIVPPSPHPPPPPPPPVDPSSSPTIASSDLPHILSGSSQKSKRFNKGSMKLPHILSDSSVCSTPRRGKSESFDFEATYVANSTYAETPSQASSVWNWENFYPPPSPPGSDYFAGDRDRDEPGSDFGLKRGGSHLGLGEEGRERESESEGERVYSVGVGGGGGGGGYRKEPSYHFHQKNQNHSHPMGVGGGDEEERESEREEVLCSEWGDHYSTTSSDSEDGEEGDDERESKSEISEDTRSRSRFGGASSVRSEPIATPRPVSTVRSKSGVGVMGRVDEGFEEDGDARSSVRSWKNGGGGGKEVCGSEDMRIVVRHKDLKEIVDSIKEYFDLAAGAGDQVSEMLETGRAQLDRSFKQLKKTVYHSSGVFSNLSSSWTSKPPLAVKYRLDATALDQPGGPKSLCSTLERLLAWEKKLYEEVKAREGVKIEHEKKLATLQSQEYKGEDEVKLDKTKASIKKLQSLIIVTSQAVNTTSSAIVGLRDSDLIPQLVELCHGLMYMWRSMNQFHEVQSQIVQQVRGLVNRTVKGESTSELHRQATRDLESAVSAWHSSFCRLIKYQRDFVRSLHGWFKLTLLPVDKEAVNLMKEPSDAFSFVDEWKLALDRLPDTVASEAIKSFVNVVHVISAKQSEEFKMKKRTETISKELEKKSSSLRNIEKKYYHSYSMVGLGFPDSGPENGQMLDARDPLAEKKAELAACQRRVEDEMLKHTKSVEVTRAMTLNNIQTGLPGVFQALTSFSSLFMEALEAACTRSYAIK